VFLYNIILIVVWKTILLAYNYSSTVFLIIYEYEPNTIILYSQLLYIKLRVWKKLIKAKMYEYYVTIELYTCTIKKYTPPKAW